MVNSRSPPALEDFQDSGPTSCLAVNIGSIIQQVSQNPFPPRYCLFVFFGDGFPAETISCDKLAAACNVFRRWGLEIMANPYADSAFEFNQIHYRAETRFALGVIYPEAICLVNLTDAA